MAWIDIGAMDGDLRTWQLSQPFTGNLIKIKNDISNINTLVSNFRGLIALNYNMMRFFDIREVFSTPEEQLILFQDFTINETKRLALRNISRSNKPNQWTVKAWVWDAVINPYIPNIIVDSDPVNLSSEALAEIQNLINDSVTQINITSQQIQQQNNQILTLITGGI